jgi:hypothetical protein
MRHQLEYVRHKCVAMSRTRFRRALRRVHARAWLMQIAGRCEAGGIGASGAGYRSCLRRSAPCRKGSGHSLLASETAPVHAARLRRYGHCPSHPPPDGKLQLVPTCAGREGLNGTDLAFTGVRTAAVASMSLPECCAMTWRRP